MSDGHSSLIKPLAAQARGLEVIPSDYRLFNFLYHWLVHYASVYFQLRMIPKQIVLYPTLDTQPHKSCVAFVKKTYLKTSKTLHNKDKTINDCPFGEEVFRKCTPLHPKERIPRMIELGVNKMAPHKSYTFSLATAFRIPI